jgi:hypothetical protein
MERSMIDDDVRKPEEEQGNAPVKPRYPLLERAKRERWRIPAELRRAMAERMGQLMQDARASRQQVCAAANAILSASKINQSNIRATIAAEDFTELDRRMTAIEKQLDERDRL